MTISEKYTIPTNVIASYNYTDIADNTGYVIYYGASTNNSQFGVQYELTNASTYSWKVQLSGSTASASIVRVINKPFDVTFNKSAIVKGKLRLQVPFTLNGGTNTIYYLSGSFSKVSDGVETAISSIRTEDRGSSSASGETAGIISNMSMNISGAQYFKSGDTLRINLEGYAKTDSGTANFYILADPQGRNGPDITISDTASTTTVPTTKLAVHVPFVINT